jgi:hypothetical protein
MHVPEALETCHLCQVAAGSPADFGVEKSVDVEGMDAAGVGKQLEQLVASKPQ